MVKRGDSKLQLELMVSVLRSQVGILLKILTHIEQGNHVNGYVQENMKLVEKDLRWLRKYYFEN